MVDDIIVAVNVNVNVKEVKSIQNLITQPNDQQVGGNGELIVVRYGKQRGVNVTLQPVN